MTIHRIGKHVICDKSWKHTELLVDMPCGQNYVQKRKIVSYNSYFPGLGYCYDSDWDYIIIHMNSRFPVVGSIKKEQYARHLMVTMSLSALIAHGTNWTISYDKMMSSDEDVQKLRTIIARVIKLKNKKQKSDQLA